MCVREANTERRDQSRQLLNEASRPRLVCRAVQAAKRNLRGAAQSSAEIPLRHATGGQERLESGRILPPQAGADQWRLVRLPLPKCLRRPGHSNKPPHVVEVRRDRRMVQPAPVAIAREQAQRNGEPRTQGKFRDVRYS